MIEECIKEIKIILKMKIKDNVRNKKLLKSGKELENAWNLKYTQYSKIAFLKSVVELNYYCFCLQNNIKQPFPKVDFWHLNSRYSKSIHKSRPIFFLWLSNPLEHPVESLKEKQYPNIIFFPERTDKNMLKS